MTQAFENSSFGPPLAEELISPGGKRVFMVHSAPVPLQPGEVIKQENADGTRVFAGLGTPIASELPAASVVNNTEDTTAAHTPVGKVRKLRLITGGKDTTLADIYGRFDDLVDIDAQGRAHRPDHKFMSRHNLEEIAKWQAVIREHEHGSREAEPATATFDIYRPKMPSLLERLTAPSVAAAPPKTNFDSQLRFEAPRLNASHAARARKMGRPAVARAAEIEDEAIITNRLKFGNDDYPLQVAARYFAKLEEQRAAAEAHATELAPPPLLDPTLTPDSNTLIADLGGYINSLLEPEPAGRIRSMYDRHPRSVQLAAAVVALGAVASSTVASINIQNKEVVARSPFSQANNCMPNLVQYDPTCKAERAAVAAQKADMAPAGHMGRIHPQLIYQGRHPAPEAARLPRPASPSEVPASVTIHHGSSVWGTLQSMTINGQHIRSTALPTAVRTELQANHITHPRSVPSGFKLRLKAGLAKFFGRSRKA